MDSKSVGRQIAIDTLNFANSVADRVDQHFAQFKHSKMQFVDKLFNPNFFDASHNRMQWPTILMGF